MTSRLPSLVPWLLLVAVGLGGVACRQHDSSAGGADGEAVEERARRLADSYLRGYFERYPDQVTYFGVEGHRHDRLQDNSLAAQGEWQSKEDRWLSEARAINADAISRGPLRAAYAIVREALEGSIGARVCRNELWNVSQVTGWQVNLAYLATIQPVGDPNAREEALARWRAVPAYIDTEIVNLREGMRLRYLAPKGNVRIVIDQMTSLLTGARSESPFLSPSARDGDGRFKTSFDSLYEERLMPAFLRYRDFLDREYLPVARNEIALLANPHGPACYAALVRLYGSQPVSAVEVHEQGLRQIEMLDGEMKAIAERTFGTSDVRVLLQRIRDDPQYRFKSREELIGYSARALERARAEVGRWFGKVPRAAVRIEPYPVFREKNAPNEYNPPAQDGSRPGVFFISAYQPEGKNRSPAESTAFHETIPGHHLQMAIALEAAGAHPIGRYIANSGFSEGWALYAERLADEMRLYSSDLDRLGMLSSQALRAARLVVDSGIHTLGWSRQRAIDYLLSHTTEAPEDMSAEVDRYIVWPGQATAYMLGFLEIRRAREDARRSLGERFDLKSFHDRLLEDGAVPITFMTSKMKQWVRELRSAGAGPS